ncbi:ATP-binding protein [Conexibacter sp. SYSU D00693]|uniref:ATP-binding protein n=1 Tax=Conexibacter sp. SYSU D00693 TaxID=2812560 RepID=UPI00196A52AE|nr:ATP-binding protein [Conexibacter sp. SYSU D00693]
MIRTLDIPRDLQAPARARTELDSLRGTLTEQTFNDTRLLLSELVTNSVRHGAGDEVRIVLDVRGDDHVRCEVVDDGDGFVPTARTKPDTEAGGWGLALVERLSAEWGVREGSTHVWFELRPAGREPA